MKPREYTLTKLFCTSCRSASFAHHFQSIPYKRLYISNIIFYIYASSLNPRCCYKPPVGKPSIPMHVFFFWHSFFPPQIKGQTIVFFFKEKLLLNLTFNSFSNLALFQNQFYVSKSWVYNYRQFLSSNISGLSTSFWNKKVGTPSSSRKKSCHPL